jgi:hypothetical protein
MKKTTTQQVFDAVCDLTASEQVVTREALQDVTGLKLTVIDDRIATLVDDGLVIRRNRGVFIPAPQHPPARPISKTILPNGMVKIEIGDEVLELTPREDRFLASLQAGAALQLSTIESGYQAGIAAGEISQRLRALESRARPEGVGE